MTQEMADERKTRIRSRFLGWVALWLIVYWTGVAVALHMLRTDMDPLARTMSEYVIGPYGWLMTTTFFALAGAVTAIGLGLRVSLPTTRGTRIGVILMYIAPAGFAIAGVFPGVIGPPQPAPPYDPATIQAYIELAGPMHDIGSLIAFLPLLVALPLVSRRFGREEHWRRIALPARLLAALYVMGFVALVVVAGLSPDFAGLTQRIFIALMLAWLLLVARHIGVRRGPPGWSPHPTSADPEAHGQADHGPRAPS